VGPIDIGLLRAERKRRIGHDMRSHLRSEMHDYQGRTWLAPAGSGEHPLTDEGIRRRIADTQGRLGADQ